MHDRIERLLQALTGLQQFGQALANVVTRIQEDVGRLGLPPRAAYQQALSDDLPTRDDVVPWVSRLQTTRHLLREWWQDWWRADRLLEDIRPFVDQAADPPAASWSFRLRVHLEELQTWLRATMPHPPGEAESADPAIRSQELRRFVGCALANSSPGSCHGEYWEVVQLAPTLLGGGMPEDWLQQLQALDGFRPFLRACFRHLGDNAVPVGEGSDGMPQRGSDHTQIGPSLTDDDVRILQYLAEQPGVAKVQSDTSAAAKIDRKTAGKRLRHLRDTGYVKRPDGKARGDMITEAGLARLKSLLDRP